MKPPPFVPVPWRNAACLAFLLALAAGPGRAGEAGKNDPAAAVEISVRSSVDQRWDGMHKGGPIEHGKIYLIASLKLAPSAGKLARPVDEAGLLAQLRQVLNSRGFRESGADEAPDIILTLLYGRGYLRNPYLANIDGDISSGSLAPTPGESLLAASVDPSLYQKRQWAHYEHKLHAAQKEKLFIRVTAWKFPGDRKEKPAEFWKTTMVVDEPDQRDLNELYPKMLAAGASFFDRHLKEEEVKIAAPLKEGAVKLGPLIILESDKGAGEKRLDER
jgi:hypothetical protein